MPMDLLVPTKYSSNCNSNTKRGTLYTVIGKLGKTKKVASIVCCSSVSRANYSLPTARIKKSMDMLWYSVNHKLPSTGA